MEKHEYEQLKLAARAAAAVAMARMQAGALRDLLASLPTAERDRQVALLRARMSPQARDQALDLPGLSWDEAELWQSEARRAFDTLAGELDDVLGGPAAR
ncbi:MAG: hypothetical protein PGN26_10720 [Xylophilus ampelinus]